MKFKKVCSLLLVATMTCSLFVTPVMATPTEDKKKAMAEQQELESKKKATQSQVNELQTQLSSLMTQINELQIQLMEKGQEIVQAEEDLAAAEEKERQQYEAMKLRIKYMYESGDSSAMEQIFSSGSISEMLVQAEYVQQVHEYDRDQLQEYANTVEEVKELKTTLEAELETLQELEVEYQTQSEELNDMIIEKSDEIDNLDELIQEAAAAVAEAAAREEAERLAAIEAAAKAAAEKAEAERLAAQQVANSSTSNSTSSSTSNSSSSNSSSNSGSSSSGSSSNSGSSSSSTATSTPSYSSSTGSAIVDRAYSCLGAAYVWGACSPGAFDCSGLVSYCLTGSYTRLGTTTTFYGWPRVSNPQPGDVCVKIGHTGIYIGGGQMIHAATEGVGVIIGPVQSGMVYVRRP